jgi:hypothetical protein
VGITGTMAGVQHTTAFWLGTQVTTFQVSSPTGSGIVHNNGQAVTITQNVPADNAPAYTTCSGPAGSGITCFVASSSPGMLTVTTTAPKGTPHGTYTLNLNGGAAKAHVAIADFASGALPTIFVVAGTQESVDLFVPAGPCAINDYCLTVVQGPSWITGIGFAGDVTAFVEPPVGTTPGDYGYQVDSCGDFEGFDDDIEEACTFGGTIEVEAPPPPPPPPPAPTVAMQLQLIGTVISTDGNYTEDSTIQVTAVDADTHIPIPTFTGTVTIAEDGTAIYSQNYPGACLVYVQNACNASSVTISSGGTTTFLARSIAMPKAEALAAPDPALLKTTNYQMDKGASFPIPQWITSGRQIDPLAGKDGNGLLPFDWFQSRVLDIRTKATADDLKTVLATISGYTLGTGFGAGAQTPGQPGSPKSPVVFNALFGRFRLDFAGDGPTCTLPAPTHELTNTVYHEARHAYQFSLMTGANDEDHDRLVNANKIPIAPTNIFVDTTDSRLVCNELANPADQVQPFAFKGPNNPDAIGALGKTNGVPGVSWAIEMDAWYFAFRFQ